MGDFSLVPSLVVLGAVLVGLAALSTVLTRRSRQRRRDEPAPEVGGGAPVRVAVDDLVRQAGIQLVQMDDGLRAGREELLFARAEFGDASVHEFAEALETAGRRASEAFALKQQLDDHVPDSEQQRREWSKRILSLSDSALALVTAQSRAFGERRRREVTAPVSLERVRDDLAGARARLPEAAALLADLAARYDTAAVATVAGNDTAAAASFDEAGTILDEAEASLRDDSLAPVAKRIDAAAGLVRSGRSLLDAVGRMRESLLSSAAALQEGLTRSRARLAEAARLRDTVEDPEAAARITAAAARLAEAVTAASRPTDPGSTPTHVATPTIPTDHGRAASGRATPAAAAPPATAPGARRRAHPAADVDALDAAAAALDETLAIARSAQQRLDSARDALQGALAIAESHIGTASDFIDGRRGQVGPDARTRLADARRELELARLDADPVAALDAARRAATRATDADALARYDVSSRA